jgi:DNA segregation ATPase FtsK/SpoIIIE, S-DNA-T family
VISQGIQGARKETMAHNRRIAPKKVEKKAEGQAVRSDRRHEVAGVIFSLAAGIVLLSLASYDPADPIFHGAGAKAQNLVGLVGAYLADGLLFCLGVGAFLIVGALAYVAGAAFTRGGLSFRARKVVGYTSLVICAAALAHILLDGRPVLGHAPGGLLGEVAGGLCVSLLASAGSVVVLSAGALLALIAATGFSLTRAGRLVGRGLAAAGLALGKALAFCGRHTGRALAAAGLASGRWLREQAREFARALRERPEPALAHASLETGPGPDCSGPVLEAAILPARTGRGRTRGLLAPPVSDPPPLGRREPAVVTSDPPPADEPALELDGRGPAEIPSEPGPRPEPAPEPVATPATREAARRMPEIVIPRPDDGQAEAAASEVREAREEPKPSPDYRNFQLPSIDFLQVGVQEETVIDEAQLQEYAKRLEAKLKDYGIDGCVTKIMPGPVVTMYEYAPGPGIKVSKISSLSQDLALALEAFSVRIIAPIPGRAVVGIEVSNKTRKTVYVREIIEHPVFAKSKSKLTLVLGKNIEGAPFVTDLNKMPHLLVAGATGTGKSVALNTMIASILYKATPEDVRFIMVDPKVLELSLYEGIPHLLLPVVTDPRKAQAALQWAVNEMERRIRILHSAGVRNLDAFNKKVEKLEAGAVEEAAKDAEAREAAEAIEAIAAADDVDAVDEAAAVDTEDAAAQVAPEPGPAEPAPAEAPPVAMAAPGVPRSKKILVIDRTAAHPEDELQVIDVKPGQEDGAPADGPRWHKLPHVVIVIDELADLMMTASREVETNIARIAQKARAAGIHLIVATQRPSVNVITGLIKANLPARISFRVASKVDARTILDANGSESLLGNGDMLFHPPTTSELIRVHGALITEEEIEKLVLHLRKQGEPVYDESILASAEEGEEGEGSAEEEDHDEMYDLAVQIVSELGQASTSMVQRKLRIGYNRAARLIERMEREGIVGPADGARPREVLIHNPMPT